MKMEFDIKKFRKDLITKRCIENDMTMDEASLQIGISKPTLSRIEKSKIPHMGTFTKLCVWLKKEPNEYFLNNTQKND